MSDYVYSVSEALSEVMGDIGVNEKLVMKRRRVMMLKETMNTITQCSFSNLSVYIFGSQIEGSTTAGLESDYDQVATMNGVNVLQSINEWKQGAGSMKMVIQNENISPGYCYLQKLRSDQPLPETVEDMHTMDNHSIDSEGRVLQRSLNYSEVTNFYGAGRGLQQHGPALTTPETQGLSAEDTVVALYCASLPLQALSRLQELRCSKWPSENVKRYCLNAGCFFVSVGSKGSDIPDLEWRISTSLQERYLMCSLNITQLRCYVLLKMILKTHINPHLEDVLSSFMCKNVLLYCVTNSSQDWHTGTLLSYLHLCLFMLNECVKKRNCPHFIIPENNLLAGRMTEGQRDKLLGIIGELIDDDEQTLFHIQIDDLGRRLKMKLNAIPYCPELPSCTDIALRTVAQLMHLNASHGSSFLNMSLTFVDCENVKVEQSLSKILSNLKECKEKGSLIQQNACELFIPLVSSSLGSVIASINIDTNTAISDEALAYLQTGKESDVSSGRLKLVSVLYCIGNIEMAERELGSCQQLYNSSVVEPVCSCYNNTTKPFMMRVGFVNAHEDDNVEAIKSLVALCVRFLKSEMNCVPHELRFEILRSYLDEDRQMRTGEDSSWMELIVVDSITYLYFLQYKANGHLNKRKVQLQALSNFIQTIENEFNLRHEETALNLLGQCLEQENRQTEALQCYIRSLKHRTRNNAARFLLCLQLYKLLKRDNKL